jgi:phosphate transport system substrate-binding protein
MSTTTNRRPAGERLRHALAVSLVIAGAVASTVVGAPAPAGADGPTVSGTGSSFVGIEIEQWRVDAARPPLRLSINYVPGGSTLGREAYMANTHDYAVSDIPFQPGELERGGSAVRPFTYVPISAGGVGFMFNVEDAVGNRIEDLNLSPRTVCRMFSEPGMQWNDPEVVAENPDVQLPAEPVKPVLRVDGAGTSFVLMAYCIETAPDVWERFIALVQNDPVLLQSADAPFLAGEPSSRWPAFAGTTGYGAAGVADTVANPATGRNAITYNEAGYALERGFPNAWVRNAAGVYLQPSARAVNIALGYAIPSDDGTFTLEYNAPDPGAYFPATYSYVIAPTSGISEDKGRVLATFLYYCATSGQAKAEGLGYAPLSRQVTDIALRSIPRIPGAPPPPSPTGATDPPTTLPAPTTAPGGGGSTTSTGAGGATTASTGSGGGAATTAPPGSGGTTAGTSAGGGPAVTVPVTAADGSVVTAADGSVVTAEVSNGTAVVNGIVVAVDPGGVGTTTSTVTDLEAAQQIAAREPDDHEVALMFLEGAALFLVGSVFAHTVRSRIAR